MDYRKIQIYSSFNLQGSGSLSLSRPYNPNSQRFLPLLFLTCSFPYVRVGLLHSVDAEPALRQHGCVNDR